MNHYQGGINTNNEIHFGATRIHKGPIFGQRHVQAILLFFGVTIEMMSRSTLSWSIVEMNDDSTTANSSTKPPDKWILISSIVWGCLTIQWLGGKRIKDYGVKWLIFGAVGLNSLALALLPAAHQSSGSTGVMICRIMQGLSQRSLYPSCHAILGRWAPKFERGLMFSIIYSGMYFGNILCLPIARSFANSSLGWPAPCYLFGCCGLVWTAIWIFYGHNSPVMHPSISLQETQYITASLNQTKDKKFQVIPTPWTRIFCSLHFWACVVISIGSGFGTAFVQSKLPSYLGNVMWNDVTSKGFYAPTTAAIGFGFTCIYGPLSDFIVEKNYFSQTNVRRIFGICSSYGCAATLLILTCLNKSHSNISIFILDVLSIFSAGIIFGHGINTIDLSPRFCGILWAFANSLSYFMAFTAPLAVQSLVSDQSNASEWKSVFYITAALYVVPATFFAIFLSGKTQWWDDVDDTIENVTQPR